MREKETPIMIDMIEEIKDKIMKETQEVQKAEDSNKKTLMIREETTIENINYLIRVSKDYRKFNDNSKCLRSKGQENRKDSEDKTINHFKKEGDRKENNRESKRDSTGNQSIFLDIKIRETIEIIQILEVNLRLFQILQKEAVRNAQSSSFNEYICFIFIRIIY